MIEPGLERISRRGALGAIAAGSAGFHVGGRAPHGLAAAPGGPGGTAPFINVVDFGAVGNGTTDDTAAIRAALATITNAGGCVYFPPGNYLVSDSLTVDYATTLVGANPAASVLQMDPNVVKDLIVGGPSFPVRINILSLTLDGGLTSQARDDVPRGNGIVTVGGPVDAGDFADIITVSGGTCTFATGDVLRVAGQPVVVVNDANTYPVGFAGSMYVCNWAPATPIDRGRSGWRVFKEGNLVSGCGRLVVNNCILVNAKRHAIDLAMTTQGNIGNCEIGGQHGCGIFGWSATDFAVSDCWFFGCGGPHIYLNEAVDVRINNSYFEGSGSANIYADRSELEISNCGLWGGRASLVYAHNSSMAKLSGLKLRDPGYGANSPDSFASSGFAPLDARPAVDVHFSAERYGLQATHCTLHNAAPRTGPIFAVANGSRSNLSSIEWDASVTFEGGKIIDDRGTSTIVRGFRGVADKN